MIVPEWPAPKAVVALSTCRVEEGGRSGGVYHNFNLGQHVGDDPAAVDANREHLQGRCEGLRDIAWLNQVHGTLVVPAQDAAQQVPPVAADAAITGSAGVACAVMTADCLPVLLCDRQGCQVAAAHAGWRGLCDGALATTVAAFACPPQELMAWLGPAISQRHFEVGGEVRRVFLDSWPDCDRQDVDKAFCAHPTSPEKYFGDLYQLATIQLRGLGVTAIFGGDRCTFAEPDDFFSFRRDGVTGRQASLIYIRDL